MICLYNLINEEDAEKKDSLALIFLKLLEKEEEIKKKIDELREKTYENIISLVMNCIFNKEAEKNEKDIKDFLIEKVGKLYTSKNLKGKEVQNKKEIKEDKITSLLGKKNSFDERVYFDKKKMIQEFSINAFDAFELPLNKINKLKIKNIKIYKSEEAYDVKYKIDGDSFCVALGKDLLSLSSKDNVLDMLLKAILNYGLEEKYQRKKGKDEVFCQEAALDEIYKEKPEFWFFIKGINAFVKKTLFKKGEIYKPFFKDKEELNDFFKSVCYYHNEAILYSKNPIKFFKKYFKFKGLYFDEIVDILNEDIEELSDIKYKKIKELISNIPRLKVYKFNSKEKLKGIRHEIVKNLQDNSDFYNIFLAEDFIDIITHMNVSSLTLKKIVEIFIKHEKTIYEYEKEGFSLEKACEMAMKKKYMDGEYAEWVLIGLEYLVYKKQSNKEIQEYFKNVFRELNIEKINDLFNNNFDSLSFKEIISSIFKVIKIDNNEYKKICYDHFKKYIDINKLFFERYLDNYFVKKIRLNNNNNKDSFTLDIEEKTLNINNSKLSNFLTSLKEKNLFLHNFLLNNIIASLYLDKELKELNLEQNEDDFKSNPFMYFIFKMIEIYLKKDDNSNEELKEDNLLNIFEKIFKLYSDSEVLTDIFTCDKEERYDVFLDKLYLNLNDEEKKICTRLGLEGPLDYEKNL